jgi:hypothetical protein
MLRGGTPPAGPVLFAWRIETVFKDFTSFRKLFFDLLAAACMDANKPTVKNNTFGYYIGVPDKDKPLLAFDESNARRPAAARRAVYLPLWRVAKPPGPRPAH